jgi:hypothetical protein
VGGPSDWMLRRRTSPQIPHPFGGLVAHSSHSSVMDVLQTGQALMTPALHVGQKLGIFCSGKSPNLLSTQARLVQMAR